ncbi:hypothetical protein HK096_010028 [Nowakowskiella sp. JEL0078]|nr:hypothetical protein HK096_010028 [Nowakowskiella sp. JEL0078]
MSFDQIFHLFLAVLYPTLVGRSVILTSVGVLGNVFASTPILLQNVAKSFEFQSYFPCAIVLWGSYFGWFLWLFSFSARALRLIALYKSNKKKLKKMECVEIEKESGKLQPKFKNPSIHQNKDSNSHNLTPIEYKEASVEEIQGQPKYRTMVHRSRSQSIQRMKKPSKNDLLDEEFFASCAISRDTIISSEGESENRSYPTSFRIQLEGQFCINEEEQCISTNKEGKFQHQCSGVCDCLSKSTLQTYQTNSLSREMSNRTSVATTNRQFCQISNSLPSQRRNRTTSCILNMSAERSDSRNCGLTTSSSSGSISSKIDNNTPRASNSMPVLRTVSIKKHILPTLSSISNSVNPELARAELIKTLLSPEDVKIAQSQWALLREVSDIELAASPTIFFINWTKENAKSWIGYLGISALFLFSYVLCIQLISQQYMEFGNECTLFTVEMSPLLVGLVIWFFILSPVFVRVLSLFEEDTFGIRTDLITGAICGVICTVMAIIWIFVFPFEGYTKSDLKIQQYWRFENWTIVELLASHVTSLVIPLASSHGFHPIQQLNSLILNREAQSQIKTALTGSNKQTDRLPQISASKLEHLGGWTLFAATLDDEGLFESFKQFAVRDFCAEKPIFYQEYRKLMQKVNDTIEIELSNSSNVKRNEVQGETHNTLQKKYTVVTDNSSYFSAFGEPSISSNLNKYAEKKQNSQIEILELSEQNITEKYPVFDYRSLLSENTIFSNGRENVSEILDKNAKEFWKKSEYIGQGKFKKLLAPTKVLAGLKRVSVLQTLQNFLQLQKLQQLYHHMDRY